jgi:hypothetical protein
VHLALKPGTVVTYTATDQVVDAFTLDAKEFLKISNQVIGTPKCASDRWEPAER